VEKSTHRCEVFRVERIENHPNADRLEIIYHDHFTTVVQKNLYKINDLVCFIPPDSIVNTNRPEFNFLKKEGRDEELIRAIKLRGIVSYGLVVKPPSTAVEGDNLAEYFDVKHYEPEQSIAMYGDNVKTPSELSGLSKYDVDSARKYIRLFNEGEEIAVTEKIHGANARYCCVNGIQYCGSRTGWKLDDKKCPWWKAYRNHPEILEFCQNNPLNVLFGEVYGQVQTLKYGLTTCKFVAFDIFANGKFLNYDEFVKLCTEYDILRVPELYRGPLIKDEIWGFADGPSILAKINGATHHREGCVFGPVIERYDEHIGRLKVKIVGSDYLTSKRK
jgi:RNA ligase (TIGR02306 family)